MFILFFLVLSLLFFLRPIVSLQSLPVMIIEFVSYCMIYTPFSETELNPKVIWNCLSNRDSLRNNRFKNPVLIELHSKSVKKTHHKRMKLWILVFGDTGNSIWTENLACFEWDSGSKLRFCEVQVVNLSYLHSTLFMHYKYKVCIYSNEVEFIFHQKETGVLDNFMQSANSWVNIKFMPCSPRHDNFLIYKYLIQEILVVHDF